MIDAATVNAIKSIVETIAIAVSGLWIAWTFHKLQSVRAAEADITFNLRAAEKSAVETAESERRLLSQQPNLDITIAAVVEHHLSDGDGAYLALSVNLRNLGSRNLTMTFDKATLTVARFTLTDDGLTKMSDVYRTGVHYLPERGSKLLEVPYRIMRVGQERQVAFLAPVPGAGLYLIQFQALYGALPFENEEGIGDVASFAIQALQQRLVRVNQEGSRTDPETAPMDA